MSPKLGASFNIKYTELLSVPFSTSTWFFFFFFLAALVLNCRMQDLQLQQVGSSSLTRDQTWAPCIEPLDNQGSPTAIIFKMHIKFEGLHFYSFLTTNGRGESPTVSQFSYRSFKCHISPFINKHDLLSSSPAVHENDILCKAELTGK